VAAVLTAGTHGSTFGGTPFVASVALATLTTIIGEQVPAHAARMGHDLMQGLRAIQATGAPIATVRGKGLLIGIELTRPASPYVDACRAAGLLVLSAGEKVLRLAPPLIVDTTDCQRALGTLGDVLKRDAT
jgi:acetylornithine/succinyldiaminopimelate/putrescine aminotransferase